jgi:starch synthase
MEILLVATELDLKSSSLDANDEILALAKTFKQLGHDVTVLAPFDENIENSGLLVARRLTPLVLPSGQGTTVFDAQLASGTKLVLLGLSAAKHATNGKSLASFRGAIEFAQSVAAFVEQRAEQPQAFDVVHLFDWAAAPVAMALRATLKVVVPSIVLSIRESSPPERLAMLANPELCVALTGRELDAPAVPDSVWRQALSALDAVIVPSEGYVDAWAQPSTGNENPLLMASRATMFAVAPGVDYARCNPATNPCLVARYDAENPEAKRVSKTALLKRLGLELDERPLVLIADFAADAASATLVGQSLESLLDRAVTFAIHSRKTSAGAVVEQLESRLRGNAGRIAHFVVADEDDLHRALAAADFVVYASQRASGYAGHFAAQRYGAIVIGPAVAGLRDAVVDCDAALESGTGFLFDDATPAGLLGALARAEVAYAHPAFARLRRRVMRHDCSWDRPSRRLLQIYKRAASGKLRDVTAELTA